MFSLEIIIEMCIFVGINIALCTSQLTTNKYILLKFCTYFLGVVVSFKKSFKNKHIIESVDSISRDERDSP